MAEKEGKLIVKKDEVRWIEGDWRGLIALISTAGYIALLLVAMLLSGTEAVMMVAAIMGEPYGLVIGWYFAKGREKVWRRRS
ncbi:MAG: hypothetical protein H3Z50_00210 [archaeon]|nr:hypothetical protein [archaeon]MCP8305883.1 hypothetical protein [archaeon]